jgi:hypothetical protein
MAGRSRVLAVAAIGVLAALGPLARPVAGEAGGLIGCALTGTADFSPAGPGQNGTFGFTLRAPIRCLSAPSGGPTAGVLTVGTPLTESVPITLANGTVVQGTAEYQTNAGQGWQTFAGANGCGSSEYWAPNAFFSWSDGTVTQATLSGINVGPIVEFDGITSTGAVLPLVPGSERPKGAAPSTHVVFSDNPDIGVFENYNGLAVVTAANPLGCITSAGVNAASIAGSLEFGQGENIPKP